MCSSAVVWLTLVRPRGRWVHPGPLGSLVYAMGVIGFICGGTWVRLGGRWVHSEACRWVYLVSHRYALGVVGCIRGCWDHPVSLGSLGSALGSLNSCRVVGSIRGHRVHSGAPWGFILCSWVHSYAPWGSLGSSEVVEFTQLHPGGRWVHLWSLASLECALRALGSSGIVRFTRVRPVFRWVHPGSFDSLKCTLGVVGFILGRWV